MTTAITPPHRAATPGDARALAELVNMAGEGMPVYLWSRHAEPGESAWDIGARRARREEGAFSYRNAVVREQDGEVVAALIGYPVAAPSETNYDDMPAMFVPLQQLEDEVPGTWYVNVLASRPGQRGKGYGSELLQLAEALARHDGCSGLSLIVSDHNDAARRLYERVGFREMATRPAVTDDWENPVQHWVLLVKPF